VFAKVGEGGISRGGRSSKESQKKKGIKGSWKSTTGYFNLGKEKFSRLKKCGPEGQKNWWETYEKEQRRFRKGQGGWPI